MKHTHTNSNFKKGKYTPNLWNEAKAENETEIYGCQHILKRKPKLNPSSQEAEAGRSPKFKTSQVYSVSSRNPVLLLVFITVFESTATVTQWHTVNRDGGCTDSMFPEKF